MTKSALFVLIGVTLALIGSTDSFARQSRRACMAECHVRYEDCRKEHRDTRPRCGERRQSCLEDCPE